MDEKKPKCNPIVIVHGGTWAAVTHNGGTGQRGQRRRRAAEEAAQRAYATLMDGGSCIDAVEAAVTAMEDCSLFRVGGRGASANAVGDIETDAIITEGRRSACGAVFAVQSVANPIKAARAVMEKTQHIMFSGRPASEFAHDWGFNLENGESESSLPFGEVRQDTPPAESRARVSPICQGATTADGVISSVERRRSSLRVGGNSTGTSVGAIAIDKHGRVACAASCGGASNGLPGRVNESAIIGTGVYAIHSVGGAVACGRNGEALSRSNVAYAVCQRMKEGASPQEAAKAVLSEAAASGDARSAGSARLGVITLSKSGEFGVYFTAGQMPWAVMTAGQVMSGLGADFDTAADAFACLGPEPVIPSSALLASANAVRQPIILVHGGAGSWDVLRGCDLDVTCYYDGVKAAAVAGYRSFHHGGSAMDAVVAAVRCLEDDSTFNAGRGSRYTSRRTIEMDAMVMDGRAGGRAAGVATVSNVRNPVLLARALLDSTAVIESKRCPRSTLLVDGGAVSFARAAGLELAEDSYFESPTSDMIFARDTRRKGSAQSSRRNSLSDRKRRPRGHLHQQPDQQQSQQLQLVQAKKRQSRNQAPICAPTLAITRSARDACAPYETKAGHHHSGAHVTSHHGGEERCHDHEIPQPDADLGRELPVDSLVPSAIMEACDTVGAVAVDAYGNVACATSTGGKNFKLSGRVGDSPIAGCGGYADNAVGAVSTTGSGEFIARSMLARVLMDNVRKGMSISEAAVETIKEANRRLGAFSVGLVAVDRDGTPAVAFNTQGMSWAMVKDCRITYGLHGNDLHECDAVWC